MRKSLILNHIWFASLHALKASWLHSDFQTGTHILDTMQTATVFRAGTTYYGMYACCFGLKDDFSGRSFLVLLHWHSSIACFYVNTLGRWLDTARPLKFYHALMHTMLYQYVKQISSIFSVSVPSAVESSLHYGDPAVGWSRLFWPAERWPMATHHQKLCTAYEGK